MTSAATAPADDVVVDEAVDDDALEPGAAPVEAAAERAAQGRVLLFTLVLGILTTPLCFWLGTHYFPPQAWVLAVVFALFVAGELFTVDIEFRRESHTFSFSTVPLVIGLFTLPPALVVVLRVLASMGVLWGHRRQPVFKLLVNLTSHVLEVAVAGAVVVLLAPEGPFRVDSWLVAGLAVIVADFVGAMVITGAISSFQGEWEPSLLGGIWMGMVVAGADLIIAVLVITLREHYQPAVVLVLAVGAFVVVVSRAYAQISSRYHGLELLDRFTRALGEAVYEGTVVARLLREAGEILHADHAWLVVRNAEGLRRVELHDGELAVVDPDALDAAILERVTDAAVLVDVEDPRFPELADAGHDEMIAVRLAAREGEELALVVADRSGAVRPFDEKDSTLFETLAVHAALALQNVGLVSQLRAEVEVTEHLATHDVLTELPNRSLFHHELQTALHDPGRTGELAVMLIDLDRFKDVNDTLGHHNGDQLLAEVGQRLRSALDDDDVIARLGGDEFAVMLRRAGTVGAAVEVGQRLVQALLQPFTLADVEVDVGASVGVAMSSATVTDAATLLRQADVAMYTAKEEHTGVEVYSPDRDHYSPQRLALVGRLRAAIEKGELTLNYQPQIDLQTGEVRGAEALVRWPQPGRSPIPPDEFIYVAEHTGLIRPLTRLVLGDAIAQAARWYHQGRRLRVSVNLSPHNMIERGLPEEIADMLSAADLPPEMLMIELTETTVMSNPGRTVEIMNTLREIGCPLAIDDFGTGHSSLAYLTGLPATELKIDKSFVFAMGTDPAADTVVRAIVDLGRNLGLEVVAEGVETELAAAALRDMQCAVGQGYLYSRPVEPRAFEHWLANYDAERDEARRRVLDPSVAG